MLTREELLGRRKRRYDIVDLPGGGQVRIQSLTEGERTRHELKTSDSKGRWSKTHAVDARCHMIAISVVDEAGELLFDEQTDLDAIREMDSADAAVIYAACLDLNAGKRADDDDETEAASKNLSGPTDGESPDVLPFDGASPTS